MRSVLSALALLSALPLIAFEPSTGPSPDRAALATSHTVRIAYASTDGALRPATIRITRQRDARPTWRGAVEQIAVRGPDGWILIESVRRIEGGVEARGDLPAPRQITAFAILTDRGESHVWTNPSTYDGPEGDTPEGERGCPGVTCMEIIDPWTCTCSDPDPWGDDDEEDGEEETETSEETGGDDKDEFMSFGI